MRSALDQLAAVQVAEQPREAGEMRRFTLRDLILVVVDDPRELVVELFMAVHLLHSLRTEHTLVPARIFRRTGVQPNLFLFHRLVHHLDGAEHEAESLVGLCQECHTFEPLCFDNPEEGFVLLAGVERRVAPDDFAHPLARPAVHHGGPFVEAGVGLAPRGATVAFAIRAV